MRIGTFLLGGLAGAAAVIYFTDKKNRSMMLNFMTSPADAVGKALSKTSGKAADAVINSMAFGMNNGKKSGSNANAGAAGNSGVNDTASSAATSRGNGNSGTTGAANTTAMNGSAGNPTNGGANGLSQVEQIVNQDPELKRTVNEILSDSGKAGARLQ